MALVGVFDDSDVHDPRDADALDSLRCLDGKFVRLDVGQQTYTLEEMVKEEAIAALETRRDSHRRSTKTFKLKVDDSVRSVVHLGPQGERGPSASGGGGGLSGAAISILRRGKRGGSSTSSAGAAAGGLSDAQRIGVGAKAAQLHDTILAFDWGRRLREFMVIPPACAVPTSFYSSFMREIAGAQDFVNELAELSRAPPKTVDLASSDYLRAGVQTKRGESGDGASATPPVVNSLRLSAKTAKIGTPIQDEAEETCSSLVGQMMGARESETIDRVVAEIRRVVERWAAEGRSNCSRGIILRSSTNVEDLPGFSGAGLYDSCKISADRLSDDASVAAAIRKVYASMWKYGGYSERRIFGISQLDARMALLVMPYAKNIVCNGVAVSTIPFRSDFPGVFINVQHEDMKVTDADGQPEQIAVYDEHGGVPEIVSRSDAMGGRPILSAADARRIFHVVMALHRRLIDKHDETANAVDVEFVLVGEERKLQLLQCRPCLIRSK